jgi:NADH:ubiquinone oxidoreductase subunit K
MLEYYLFLVLLLFYIRRGIFVFRSQHKHLLVTLLRLEYVILNIFLILIMNIRWEARESYLSLIFLIFAVSEGRVGLSLLVSISRRHGGDQLKSFNLLW